MSVTVKLVDNGWAFFADVNNIVSNEESVEVWQDDYIINKYGEKEYDERCTAFSKDEIIYLEIEKAGQKVRWFV